MGGEGGIIKDHCILHFMQKLTKARIVHEQMSTLQHIHIFHLRQLPEGSVAEWLPADPTLKVLE